MAESCIFSFKSGKWSHNVLPITVHWKDPEAMVNLWKWKQLALSISSLTKRNPRLLIRGLEGTVRTGHETTDWFQIRKGGRQGCILSPCLSNFYAEYIMRNAELNEAQAGVRIAAGAAAAAAAKSLQSCPTLCDPIDGSPPGSPIPGIFQARTLEWVAISFTNA